MTTPVSNQNQYPVPTQDPPTELTDETASKEPVDKRRRNLIALLASAGVGAAVVAALSPAARDFFAGENPSPFIIARESNGKRFVEYGGNSYEVQYKLPVELVPYEEINIQRRNAVNMPSFIRQANPNLDNLEVTRVAKLAEHLYGNPVFENLREGETVRIPYNPNLKPKIISETSKVPVLKLEQIIQ